MLVFDYYIMHKFNNHIKVNKLIKRFYMIFLESINDKLVL